MRGTFSINLASEPFRKDRPMVVASIATGVLMVSVLAMLVYLIWIERDEGTETALAIQQIQSQLDGLVAEETRLEGVLLRPENAEVLERSLFLNALLTRKGISWTMIFADLEEVLPYNVKLVQVRPQVSMHNEIRLDMDVASATTEPVIDMLKALENSDLFGSTSVSVSLPPSDSEPLYRYRVSVNYAREL